VLELNLDKLAKLVAHFDNPNEHERMAAVRRVADMLQQAGKRFSELPELFSKRPANDDHLEEVLRRAGAAQRREEEARTRRAAEAAARQQAEEHARAAATERKREELRRRIKPQRESLIARYGSERAALESRGLERSVETAFALAIKEWRIARRRWDEQEPDLPEPFIDAIRRPGPFPNTITGARVEINYWKDREDELALLHYAEPGSTDFLSRPCLERHRMVENAFFTGLRAATIEEVIMRQRAYVDGEFTDVMGKHCEAVLADLEKLSNPVGMPIPSVQSAHPTATERRKEVVRIITGRDGEGLSDREIARRLGIPNTTVSAIRRRLEAQREAARTRKRHRS
jgi:DNA-binding CsgD family transcriptional regulator